MLPPSLIKAIEEATLAIEKDIADRKEDGKEYSDLDLMKKELLEMKLELRKEASEGMNYIIRDSMDWNQPCLKNFSEVRVLLSKYYRKRG
jgi:hypothetical protein